VEWSGETHIYILPGVVQCPKLLLLLVVVDSRHRHHDKDSAENRKTLPNYATIRQTSHVLLCTKTLALGSSSPQATPFRHFQRGPKQRISMPRSTETPETDPSAPRVRSPCPATVVRTKNEAHKQRKGGDSQFPPLRDVLTLGHATTFTVRVHGPRVLTRLSQDRPGGRNSSQRNAGVFPPGAQSQLRDRGVG
jgi:hypothetical protein